MTPPAEPVMQPMMMATQNGCPMARLFWMPAMVKSARPKVSKTNQAFLSGSIHLPKKTTVSRATPVHIKYIGVVIQKGIVPSMTSRIVPPPMATATPQTYPPNQSKCLAAA